MSIITDINLEKQNFHWREGFSYNFPIKRELFSRAAKEIESKQIVSITGLRRTGKSTILKQLIDKLIESGTNRGHILLFSFDESQPKIEDIIKEHEKRLGKEFLKINEKIYIFFDEIQKLEDWQNQVKFFYDNYSNIKFFVSGSASLFIKKHAKESLAGRIYELVLEPLSFSEFLVFRGKESLLEKPQMSEEQLKNEFSAYLKRQFIEIVNESEEKCGEYIKSILEKVIYQDIPKVFPIENEELLMRIIRIVASQPGMLSDYEALSKELGINRITLSNYFFYLEESFLLKRLYNFSKNMLTSEKKMKKIYLSASFFAFLCNETDETKIAENIFAALLKSKFFWRSPQKHEVDIVMAGGEKIIPVEIKYKENVSKKDMHGLLHFCKKFGARNAVLVTKNAEGKEELFTGGEKISVALVPAWKFALQPTAYF